MKTRKTILSIAVALTVSAFVSAQSTEVKYYTPEQLQRAASKDEGGKKGAQPFTEAPAGTATSTVTVAHTNTTSSSVNQASKSAETKPATTNATYSDKDALAAERANGAKPAIMPKLPNKQSNTATVAASNSTVKAQPAKAEVHYGPTVKAAQVTKSKNSTAAPAFKHPEPKKPSNAKAPKSGAGK